MARGLVRGRNVASTRTGEVGSTYNTSKAEAEEAPDAKRTLRDFWFSNETEE